MKKISCISILILFSFFIGCAGPHAKRTPQAERTEKTRAKIFAILPFNYIGIYPPPYSNPEEIVAEAIEMALRDKGYPISTYQTVKKKLSTLKFSLDNMTKEQAVKVGHLLNVDMLFYGYISSFNETEGQYATMSFVIRAFDVSSQTIVLRENLSKRYSTYRDPRRIAQELASRFVEKLRTMGYI